MSENLINKAELGFGIMRFQNDRGEINYEKVRETLDEYMKGNFRYFDLHPAYVEGQAQRILKEYIVKRYDRSLYYIANKMPYYGVISYADYNRIFQKELMECGVEYFDYYMLHSIKKDSYLMHKQLGGFKFLKQVKQAGLVKYIGISFHGNADLLKEILELYPELDFVQLQINFVDWEDEIIDSRACYMTARKYKKKIIVMEPIKGGTLCNELSLNGKVLTPGEVAEIALRFVSNLPGIAVVLSGMTEAVQVRENRLFLTEKKLTEDVYIQLRRSLRQRIACTKCGYCKLECKKGIDIPKIISAINESYKKSGDGLTRRWMARLYYLGGVDADKRASNCIACGKCEKKCPQQLPIVSLMKQARELFECEIDRSADSDKPEILYLKNLFLEHSKEICKKFQKGKYKIIPWGAGTCFKKNVNALEEICHVDCVMDLDKQKAGNEIVPGVTAVFPGSENIDKNSVFIVIMSEKKEIIFEIEKSVKEYGFENYDIFWNWIDYAHEVL